MTNNQERNVPAGHFVGTVAANIDNAKLSDIEFRQFVRNTLPIVIYDGCDELDGNSRTDLTRIRKADKSCRAIVNEMLAGQLAKTDQYEGGEVFAVGENINCTPEMVERLKKSYFYQHGGNAGEERFMTIDLKDALGNIFWASADGSDPALSINDGVITFAFKHGGLVIAADKDAKTIFIAPEYGMDSMLFKEQRHFLECLHMKCSR